MNDGVTERIKSFTESDSSTYTLLKRIYHVPVLVALMVFMLATRLQAIDRFQTNGGIALRGNDPWYHFRETSYLLDHFPSTLGFDPWTNYPAGTSAEHFGTLFDQLVAGFILLTSFGDPSSEYVGLIVLIAAPVFITLAVVPAYLIAARFAGRGPALAGMVVFALLPGTVLNYTLVGFYDHHGAEVFFQTLGVFAFITALIVAEREQPIWELVVDRDIAALRAPLLSSVGAGIAAALYILAWPPGILLIGFTGIFFAVKIVSDVFHERSPEPVAFVGAVSMITTALIMLIPLNSLSIGSSTEYTLLQVLLPLIVGLGSVFLAALARWWESRTWSNSLYPVAAGGSIVVSILGFAAIFPSAFSGIIGNFLNTVGFSATASARTIGEGQPFLSGGSPFAVIFGEYGLAFFAAVAAALVVLA